MSFHWSLSSDEEDIVDDLHTSITSKGLESDFPSCRGTGDGGLECQESKQWGLGNIEKDENEFDEVDWEDADDEWLDDQRDVKPTRASDVNSINEMQRQPVTIDLGAAPTEIENTDDPAKGKRVKRKRRYRFQSLPGDMQSFLQNLHRTHLLALTSHALFLSRLSSNQEVMHVSHSLIPLSWLKSSVKNGNSQDSAPSLHDVSGFCSWFFDLVNRAEERRRQQRSANFAAGAPRHLPQCGRRKNSKKLQTLRQLPKRQDGCSLFTPNHLMLFCNYLSRSFDEDPQLNEHFDGSESIFWCSQDKALLFVSMCRSLGWRARYAIVADPIKCDLDEDHPIFHNCVNNVFRSCLGNSGDDRVTKDVLQNPAKRAKLSNSHCCITEHAQNPPTFSWVEVLCHAQQNTKTNSKSNLRWIHVDPGRELVDRPDQVANIYRRNKEPEVRPSKKGGVIPYTVAVEHRSVVSEIVDMDDNFLLGHLVDVTPRYSYSWSESLRARGGGVPIIANEADKSCQPLLDTWWTKTLESINQSFRNRAKQVYLQSRGNVPTTVIAPRIASHARESDARVVDESDEIESLEQAELRKSERQEPLPTSKAAFKSHPLYVIPSILTSTQVLAPDAKTRICGVFKGELVYLRSDLSTALSAKKWLYKGRKVAETELCRPVITVKPRRRPTPKGFHALKSYGVGACNDGSEQARARDLAAASKPLGADSMEALYAVWQTVPWVPDLVGPDDKIPTNEFNNIELELINPGLVHVDEPQVAKVAKKLGIPYAPCLIGFEGQGGNRVPVTRGIVVHEHNEQLLREAQHEVSSHTLEQESAKRRDAIYLRWKRLINGVLTKYRLEQEYKDEDE